jgi:predicted glutamine amidotransferase
LIEEHTAHSPEEAAANERNVQPSEGAKFGLLDMSKKFISQTSFAHTRWATHGRPAVLNCHPHVSDELNEFSLVHNGIITNYKEIKFVLEKRGYVFKTDTDTEAVAMLCKYVYDSQPNKRLNFTDLIKAVIKELEGSFAFVFKSRHFPDEIIAARRGSPLLIGVKTDRKLKVDFVDVELPTADTDKSEWSHECKMDRYAKQILQLLVTMPKPEAYSAYPETAARDPSSVDLNHAHSCPMMACPSLSNSSSLPTLPPLSTRPSESCTWKTMTSRISAKEVSAEQITGRKSSLPLAPIC